MAVKWFGDQVIREIKKISAKGLRRAAIHLNRKVKENLSVSGRLAGVFSDQISEAAVISRGTDERGRRATTVTQTEFARIAQPINTRRRQAVRKKLSGRKRRG